MKLGASRWFAFTQAERILPPGCCRQCVSMSGVLKMAHVCPVCHSFNEKPFSGSRHQHSQSSSTAWAFLCHSPPFPLCSQECQTRNILWRLFPPRVSPLPLILVVIYHNKSHSCLVTPWCLLLRWREQTALILFKKRSKEIDFGTG